MSIMDFSGKKILVIGAGISGRAASMALVRHGSSWMSARLRGQI